MSYRIVRWLVRWLIGWFASYFAQFSDGLQQYLIQRIKYQCVQCTVCENLSRCDIPLTHVTCNFLVIHLDLIKDHVIWQLQSPIGDVIFFSIGIWQAVLRENIYKSFSGHRIHRYPGYVWGVEVVSIKNYAWCCLRDCHFPVWKMVK